MEKNLKIFLLFAKKALIYIICFFLATTISLMIIYGFYLIFPYLYTNLAHVDRETLSDDYYIALQFILLSAIILLITIPLLYFYILHLIKNKFLLFIGRSTNQ